MPLVSSPWSRLSPSPISSRREAPTRVLRARPNEHPTARAPATLCRHPRSPPTPLRTSSRPQQSSTPRTIPSGVWRPPEQAPPSPPELPVPSFSTSDDAQLCSQVSTSPCRPIFFKRPGLDHLCFFSFPNRYLLSCGRPSFSLHSEHITGNSNAPCGTSTAAAVLRRDLFLTQYSFDRFHIKISLKYILRSVTPN